MLTVFGTVAVSVMLIAYWQEARSKWFVLLFAVASAATATYSAMVGAYPILGVEALWTLVALVRFWNRHEREVAARISG
jgi:hypothetical protein